MLLTSPLSSPLKNPVRDVFSPAGSSQSLTAQVQALFAGRVGGMWDMGDIATLFQDTAGATPVTAVTQPIGRVNDKSGNGNHALQATSGARPIYSARVNLLTKTEDLTNAAWVSTVAGSAITAGVSDPIGGTTAFTITATAPNGQAYQNIVGVTQPRIASGWIRRRTGTGTIQFYADGGAAGQNITSSVTTSWTPFTVSSSTHFGSWYILLATNGDAVDVWHPQLEPGSVASRYQRVNTASDYDTVGFPAFAQFDGTDDLLNFPAINFSATDKATLVASVTLTGSTNHGLVNFGTAAAGGFHGGYYSAVGAWATTVRGDAGLSIMQVTPASMPAIPHTRVVTFEYDLAGAAAADESKIRLNGVSVPNQVVTLGPAGGGNLQNGAGVIGQSQGAFCFAGNINRFALVGGALTVGERAILEAWAAEGFGITL